MRARTVWLADWEKVRRQFTEADKDRLRAATRGQIICPRGLTVDLDAIPEELATKLEQALKTVERKN